MQEQADCPGLLRANADHAHPPSTLLSCTVRGEQASEAQGRIGVPAPPPLSHARGQIT